LPLIPHKKNFKSASFNKRFEKMVIMNTNNIENNSSIADLILLKGNVLTVDTHFSRAEAIAVKDDRILKVGTNREVAPLAGKGTKTIDLQGKTVLPGFIDVHCHMWSYGTKLSQIDCRSPPIQSIDQIIEKLQEQAKNTPKNKWVIGWGYDDTKLTNKRHPTRHDLDKASLEHPIALRRICGHTMVVNTAGLKAVHYLTTNSQPEGGEIEKDVETGELTGILRETAMNPVNAIIHTFTSKENQAAITRACQQALKEGITSYQEAGLTAQIIRAYLNLQAKHMLPVRVYMMIASNLLDAIVKTGLVTGFGNEWLKIGAIKIVMDGGMGGKTAALYEPYEGTHHNRGIIYMKQAKLNNIVKKAHDAGFQIAIHAIGDRAIDISLNALERAVEEQPRKNHRHRIEHCGLTPPYIIERLKKLKIQPIGQPPFIYNIGDSFKQNLGTKRIRWTYPFKTWFNEGLHPSGSSDRPAGSSDYAPLIGIWAAVNRRTETGKILAPEEKITIEQAIRMYTINAAYTNFEENEKGSIEQGKLADMVVLSDDPTKIALDDIKAINIKSTIVGGQIAYGSL
jgi:predicted amidohydrolase YtcJ